MLLPFFPPLALALRLTGEGEVFYIQQRVGLGGNTFGLLKLATMLKDSPNLPGGDVTVEHDPRILPLGGFLRKTKLNELPQLWNVFRGQMSLVGPRPLTPGNFKLYPYAAQEVIKKMKPGLTGIGSVVFRDEEKKLSRADRPPNDYYREVIAPYKGRLEMWYGEHRSLALDFKLVILTILVVLAPGLGSGVQLLKGLPEPPKELQDCF